MRLLWVLVLATAVQAGEDKLPGADRVVFRLAEAGLGGKPRPVIEIFGDGRVRHKGKVAAAKMTRRELAELVRFAVGEQKFFDYDAVTVARILKLREPGPSCGTGYSTTYIRIALRDRKKEHSVGMLASTATTHRDIGDLTRLYAIEKRLRTERRLAQAGGRKRVMEFLKAANRRLKERYPKIEPFTIAEFGGLRRIPKGEMILPASWDQNLLKISGECATFSRRVPGKIISATVRTDPKAKPRAAAQVQG